VVCGGWLHVRRFLAREADLDTVARRVRGDARVVQDHRERGHALPDRLASHLLADEVGDEVGHVGGRDGVDRSVAEERQDPADRGAVLDDRVRPCVEAALLPSLRRVAKKPCGAGFCERSEIRYAPRGEFTENPRLPLRRLSLAFERAAVLLFRLAASEPVTDAVAAAATTCRSWLPFY
jgi:hypothetical protein